MGKELNGCFERNQRSSLNFYIKKEHCEHGPFFDTQNGQERSNPIGMGGYLHEVYSFFIKC